MDDKKKVEIKTSRDGSHTLYVAELDEHYHSVHGAVNEALHVFIDAGLNQVNKSQVNILEFGFGTGLNALLTAIHSTNKEVHYHTMEKYPVELDIVEKLNYSGLFEEKYAMLYKELHQTEWEKEQEVKQGFFITKMQCDFKDVELKPCYDLIYFDAFAPDVQPKLWTREIFNKAFEALVPGGIITTYCAKGVVRRTMQEVGFKMERLPGPPGKREMLRGVKP
ncbi:SAM-dependent methyltransferase [Labilibacter sediminis]|nr:SAM-dependent methyltransferase [Labilibacter sediminis]